MTLLLLDRLDFKDPRWVLTIPLTLLQADLFLAPVALIPLTLDSVRTASPSSERLRLSSSFLLLESFFESLPLFTGMKNNFKNEYLEFC